MLYESETSCTRDLRPDADDAHHGDHLVYYLTYSRIKGSYSLIRLYPEQPFR